MKKKDKTLISFAQKCLSNTQMKELFPANKGNHVMNTRNHEHFEVFRANTARLQESPIIYMQNLLNTEIKRKIDQDQIWSV